MQNKTLDPIPSCSHDSDPNPIPIPRAYFAFCQSPSYTCTRVQGGHATKFIYSVARTFEIALIRVNTRRTYENSAVLLTSSTSREK